ncbi:MAG: hypothetical protein HQK52_00070 [Oligoflexia bacterium]|nr:hypothetical protein [Oligoflexia bacterium]
MKSGNLGNIIDKIYSSTQLIQKHFQEDEMESLLNEIDNRQRLINILNESKKNTEQSDKLQDVISLNDGLIDRIKKSKNEIFSHLMTIKRNQKTISGYITNVK